MWLAKHFCWETNPVCAGRDVSYNLIDEEYYKPVIDLFLKKDSTKELIDQSPVKTRMLLWPRGGMKSTCDHVDTVQLILNWPDIRILYFTAEASLAEGFVGEVKAHFLIKEDEPTLMSLFFPEFVVSESDLGAKNTFTCPVYAARKTKRKEPTVYAASVGKTKSGWHYEYIKADDAVSDKNSVSAEQCDTVSNQLFLAENLLVPGGYYIDYIGTRYAETDHYGQVLERNTGDKAVDVVRTEGPGWELFENKSTNTNILIGRAVQVKPDVAKQLDEAGIPATYKNAGEQGCVLLLPHIMPFSWLMDKLAKNEKAFEGQQNQNPRPASSVLFDKIMLLRSTIPYTEMPVIGPVSQIWDLSFSKKQKKGTDYSVGNSVMWGENKETKVSIGYLQEVVRDRYNPVTLAQAIVNLAVKYRPFIIGIEGAGASHFLEPTILGEALKTRDPHIIQVCGHIDWFPVDNQFNAKNLRMGSLYPWFTQGRFKLLNTCMMPTLEKLYSEFERCMTPHHHDDIPDSIAMQLRYAPRAVQAIMENNETMMSRSDPMWNMIFEEGADQFGRLGYGPAPVPFNPEQEDMPEDEANVDSYFQFN